MSTLLNRAGMIYDYLKSKPWVKTYMNVRPMKGLVESHVNGLGFKMQSLKKDKMILLGPIKNEWRTKLILAYYNMNLMPVFLLEGCLCTFLKSSMLPGGGKKNPISEPIELNQLFKILCSYADLFRNEHMTSNDESEEIFHQRLNYFAERGLIEVSPDRKTFKVGSQERSMTLINFFSKLIMPLIDTYLITLTAIEQLCGKNLVIKQKTLVNELHVGIKSLYSQGSIPSLHSCLKETIKTAIERFQQMGVLDTTAYLTRRGNSSQFLRSPAESLPRIQEILEWLGSHRNFSKKDQGAIFTEIDETIMRTLGPLPMPRL